MAELPRELQVAVSYLEDIDDSIKRSRSSSDGDYFFDFQAQKLIDGDLALARKEINKAEAQGVDVTAARALCLRKQGDVYSAITCVEQEDRKRWLEKAVQCYVGSIQLMPNVITYYGLADAYARLKRNVEAIMALREVEKADDKDLSIEATKWIGRLQSELEQSGKGGGEGGGKGGGCFVATAVFGSPMAHEVQVLRDFRDTVLRRRAWGRIFVWVYERVGPGLARMIAERPLAKGLVRHIVLKPAVAAIRRLSGAHR